MSSEASDRFEQPRNAPAASGSFAAELAQRLGKLSDDGAAAEALAADLFDASASSFAASSVAAAASTRVRIVERQTVEQRANRRSDRPGAPGTTDLGPLVLPDQAVDVPARAAEFSGELGR